jgi:hypothetical protein
VLPPRVRRDTLRRACSSSWDQHRKEDGVDRPDKWFGAPNY